MALLKEVAALLQRDQMVAGVIEEIIERDDLFALMPFAQVNGKAYVYNRENTLAEADFIDPNEVITESSSTFTQKVETLRILAGDLDVDKFLQATQSDTNDQLATQIAAKAKGVGRKFHRTLARGNATSNPKEFNGLPQLVTGAQTITAGANGAALTLSALDELLDAVPNGADCLIMRRGTIRAYRNLLRAQSGNDAVIQMLPEFGRPMLTHNGVPIIMNEFLAGDEVQGSSQATASVYAVRLNELDGLHGLYGGDNAGLVVENIGTVQNKDATRIRLKWYTSTVLKSTKSLARLKGITNV